MFFFLFIVDPITETITFRLVAKMVRSDLLAFGFSDYGEAENADFAVMWTDKYGKHMFQVCFIRHLESACATLLYIPCDETETLRFVQQTVNEF